MKDLINIREIVKVQNLENEYDLQKALLLDRKLRLMVKEDSSLKAMQTKVFDLIKAYEDENWSNSESITDKQVEEADNAELLVEMERKFIAYRKVTIRKRLKSYDMTQQDLGVLLGHKKSYMSELINGISQFSLKDLIIIHRILIIELSKLIPTYLQKETSEKVRKSISKLNKPKLKLRKRDLIMSE
ncbi:MAG: helix-turn-helix domain-containing protein [Bacteroidota bacterium]|nr:helix-turn-helix domain-containing protein [Bacteroidota bacterium]